MNLNEISKGYLNLFVKNPKHLDLFLMYANISKLSTNIEKQAELDKQQAEELTL